MFPKVQSVSQPIHDPTVEVTQSPQLNTVAPITSLDSHQIQNQNVGNIRKEPAITVLILQTYLA
jgi:hypothetical protein